MIFNLQNLEVTSGQKYFCRMKAHTQAIRDFISNFYGHFFSIQWRSESPAGPTTAGGGGGGGGAEGAPPGPARKKYSCRNLLARGPNKLLAGGPKIVATPLSQSRTVFDI